MSRERYFLSKVVLQLMVSVRDVQIQISLRYIVVNDRPKLCLMLQVSDERK